MAIVAAKLAVPFWCSFRMPYTVNVNFTYPVPPPTTLYGLIGCAMGLPADSYDLLHQLQITVGLERSGEIIESYSRIMKRDPRNFDRRTLLIKQKLLQPEFTMYVLAEHSLAQRIAGSLMNPVYPLSLGESDDLVEVCEVAVFDEVQGSTAIIHSALPRDLEVEPLGEYQTAYLPIRFKAAKGRRGGWSGVEYRNYYLGHELNLPTAVPGWQAGEKWVVF